MNYTEENEHFVNEVVNNLLAIPNLQQEVSPLLTKELKEKFQKAGERFTEILDSFNALPGVYAELYDFDSNPNALLLIDIPATSLFIRNENLQKDGKPETVSFIISFEEIIPFYSTLDGKNMPGVPCELFQKWFKDFFNNCPVSDDWSAELSNQYKKHAVQKSIPDFYIAVQELINNYLKSLDK